MKKVFFIMLAACMAFVFVTNSFAGGNSEPAARGPVLGMYDIPMPSWIHNTPRETGDTMYFVTTGGTDGSTARKETNAASRARSDLIQYIQGKTDVLIRNYAELAGTVGNTQELVDLREGIVNRASGNTSGLRRSEHWISVDGEYWGLYTYDKVIFKADIRTEVNNSFNRNPAASAARVNSDQFFAEMDRALQP